MAGAHTAYVVNEKTTNERVNLLSNSLIAHFDFGKFFEFEH